MKTNNWQRLAALMIVAVVVAPGAKVRAQDASMPGAAPAPTVNAPAPNLPYGVPQILQLAQARAGDDMIIAYIKNSGNSYNLNADQIIYLRQQGLSDSVITAMLNQPRAGVAVPMPSTPAPPPVPSPAYAGQVAPDAAYAQTVPDSAYYSQPYYYYDQPYYYPSYAWCPPVIYYGWGGGWYGGRYYRGGYYGGGYRGGGFVGGGFRGGGAVGGFRGGGAVGGFRGGAVGGFHGGGFGGGSHAVGGGGHGGGHR